jgi:hypothetical protein
MEWLRFRRLDHFTGSQRPALCPKFCRGNPLKPSQLWRSRTITSTQYTLIVVFPPEKRRDRGCMPSYATARTPAVAGAMTDLGHGGGHHR